MSVAPPPREYRESFQRDGYAIVSGALSASLVAGLIAGLERLQSSGAARSAVRARGAETYAIRDLLNLLPEVAALAASEEMLAYVRPVLGTAAKPIRGTLFDKNPAANWKVPWHQDLAIPLDGRDGQEQRLRAEGWCNWTRKAGIPHAEPPEPFLSGRLALRLHLDDCGPENGPLRVLPGTHRRGRLSDAQTDEAVRSGAAASCEIAAGGIVAMHPLLLHASSPAVAPHRRRVIHLEYAEEVMPW